MGIVGICTIDVTLVRGRHVDIASFIYSVDSSDVLYVFDKINENEKMYCVFKASYVCLAANGTFFINEATISQAAPGHFIGLCCLVSRDFIFAAFQAYFIAGQAKDSTLLSKDNVCLKSHYFNAYVFEDCIVPHINLKIQADFRKIICF